MKRVPPDGADYTPSARRACAASLLESAPKAAMLTHDFVRNLYDRPLFALLDEARAVHRAHHPEQRGAALHAPQREDRRLPGGLRVLPAVEPLRDGRRAREDARRRARCSPAARRAKERGSTRFCMGAAWREVKDGPAFDRVLDDGARREGARARGVRARSACSPRRRPRRLKEAGLDAYNHNLDTSREHYRSIITTRTYDDRLADARATCARPGITVCSGGIIGMGESVDDRCEMLRTLANLDPQPESVPDQRARRRRRARRSAHLPPVDPLDLVRMIAIARILMPRARVRLSARAHRADARGADALHVRRGELDLLRRQAADDAATRRKTTTSRSCATRGSRAMAPSEPRRQRLRAAQRRRRS